MIVGLRGLAVRFKVLKALFKRKTRFQWFLATISESAFDMKALYLEAPSYRTSKSCLE